MCFFHFVLSLRDSSIGVSQGSPLSANRFREIGEGNRFIRSVFRNV